MPGAIDAATYLPDASVTTTRSVPVASLEIVTETPGIAAFCGSTTVPSRVAVDWARAVAATRVRINARKNSLMQSPPSDDREPIHPRADSKQQPDREIERNRWRSRFG